MFQLPGVITPGYGNLPFQGGFPGPKTPDARTSHRAESPGSHNTFRDGLKAQLILTQWQRLGASPQHSQERAESPTNFNPVATPWDMAATPWGIMATPWDMAAPPMAVMATPGAVTETPREAKPKGFLIFYHHHKPTIGLDGYLRWLVFDE